jgi:hypothetical protein
MATGRVKWPDIISLFTLKAALRIRGKINTGSVQGSIGREEGNLAISMKGSNIQVNGIPLLEHFGITGDGILSFHFQQAGKNGEVAFKIDEARLKGSLNGIQALPLTVFRTVKGSLLTGDTISIQSITLEGKGIYARLKGEITNNRLNGNMEIMMDPLFEPYALLQAVLKPYLASPV